MSSHFSSDKIFGLLPFLFPAIFQSRSSRRYPLLRMNSISIGEDDDFVSCDGDRACTVSCGMDVELAESPERAGSGNKIKIRATNFVINILSFFRAIKFIEQQLILFGEINPNKSV